MNKMGLAISKKSTAKSAVLKNDRSADLKHLFLQPNTAAVSGAPAPRSLPTVLCFHGSGHGTHQDSWLAVVQGVAEFAPILYYDRRGVGENEDNNASSPNQTPKDTVKDLQCLLRSLDLRPPYILIAHSYGGTIARTFLQSYRHQVAGMVLAETGQETPTPYDEEQCRRRIMGDKPVSVIHAVPEDPNVGDEQLANKEERRRMRRLWAEEDERLKKAQLRLSSNARYVRVDGCGHHVVRDRPDVVIEEVKWVFENCQGEPSGSGRQRRRVMGWLVTR